MKALATLMCVVAVAGCASYMSPKKPLVGHQFVEFLRAAERHAALDRPYPAPDAKTPIAGSDFTIESFSSQRIVGTSYHFAATPCVDRKTLAEELKRLGFEKEPIGVPSSHANIYARDNFRLGPGNYRSVGAEFWPGDLRCLQFLYLDYSDSAT